MWEWMRGMDEYYMKCLIGVTLISAIILLIRFLWGKKLSKRFAYGMWLAIPVFLLLVPWIRIPMPQLVADWGQETLEKLEGEVYTIILPADTELEVDSLADALQSGETVSGEWTNSDSDTAGSDMVETKMPQDGGGTIAAKVLVAVYGLIVLAILAGVVSTNVRFEHNCRHNRVYLGETPKHKLPVYRLEDITSPFLLCATMYVPEGMTEAELRYAMLHEEGHFRHGDFFWVFTRYLILAVFFYNPLVWLAFRYSGYDCELACDESVMRRIKVAEHKAYGGSLLDVIKKHQGLSQRVLLSTNMKAPKKLIRARIENIVAGRKSSVIMACVAVVLVVLVTGCGFMEQNAETGDLFAVLGTESEDTKEETQGTVPSHGEGSDAEDSQAGTESGLSQDDVVDYGDTVYFCAELLKKEPDVSNDFTTIEDKHELCAKIDKDVISFERNASMAMDMIAYVAKEAVGKKKGDTIQLIRELNGEEYHYFYLITDINDVLGATYEYADNWDYQFPKPVIGSFKNGGKATEDFGFEGKDYETGEFFVPEMNEYYSIATSSSYLNPIGSNAYYPNNVTLGSRQNAWAEGVDGYGIGEFIELRQMYMGPGADRLNITRVCIVNGYAKNKDIWEKNARVKKLNVYFGKDYMGTITLEDCMEPQYIDLSSVNMNVSNGREAVFRFEIADFYPGTKYEDTCLTGILIEFAK